MCRILLIIYDKYLLSTQIGGHFNTMEYINTKNGGNSLA